MKKKFKKNEAYGQMVSGSVLSSQSSPVQYWMKLHYRLLLVWTLCSKFVVVPHNIQKLECSPKEDDGNWAMNGPGSKCVANHCTAPFRWCGHMNWPGRNKLSFDVINLQHYESRNWILHDSNCNSKRSHLLYYYDKLPSITWGMQVKINHAYAEAIFLIF